MARKGRHETVSDAVGAPFEDETAHFALGPLRQFSDGDKSFSQAAISACIACECVLSRPYLQDAREESLRDRVVQVARDSPPLLEGSLAFPEPRLGQLTSGSFALGHHCAEKERGQRTDDNVELRTQRTLVDRLAGECAHVVGSETDRQRGHDQVRKGHSRCAESECGPDQGREDQVRQRRVAGHCNCHERRHRSDHEDSLGSPHPTQRSFGITEPGERERDHHERTGCIAKPPGAPELRY